MTIGALRKVGLFGGTVAMLLVQAAAGLGQSGSNTAGPGPMVVDASSPVSTPGPANYEFVPEEARSPDGHVLGVNARYLTLDGRPWLPVMGEMHYSRVPEAEWEQDLLKMKSAGVQIVSTYIIWIHHEEVQGEWEWSGDKDLRRFAELCRKHGLYLVVRVGPWSHGEVRNGGFPDWLLEKVPSAALRTNDPEYLGYVGEFYKQIGNELKGLMWDQGGPVIGVQIENEYVRRPGREPEHILKLKAMAREDGLKVPFYTMTGWGPSLIPYGAVLPVVGGYPDAPWDASLTKLKPAEVYAFRFESRVTADIGGGGAPKRNVPNLRTDTPFLTAEMGGGMQVTYQRRPVVSADDIAAMVPVLLGSGANLYGIYMFHGGENPEGKRTTLQESQATHYPNDMPVKTYDFEAPLSEFGQERESLRKLKSWAYLMNDFGAELAPMEPHRPEVVPDGLADLSVPRVSVRSAGSSGFVFVNNHVREYAMPVRKAFQVEVKLPEGKELRIPEKPVDVPADAYFCWPFGMDLDGVRLRYATAQPFARLGTAAAPVFAFVAQPGIAPEFVFEPTQGQLGQWKVDAGRDGRVSTEGGAIHVAGLTGISQDRIRIGLPGGRVVTILLVNQKDAEQAWKVTTPGSAGLVITPQQAFVDGAELTLEQDGGREFEARVLPEGWRLTASTAGAASTGAAKVNVRDGLLRARINGAGPAVIAVAAQQQKAPGEPAPLSRPKLVAAAPTEADWSRAGVWSLRLPQVQRAPGERDFLRIRYAGDVARLSAGDRLLDDNFFDGEPWTVGLERFRSSMAGRDLKLAIYPLRTNPPIFFEPELKPKTDGADVVGLTGVELVRQFQLRLEVKSSR